MSENKDYITCQEEMGAVQISEEVIASIAAHAAAEVDGVSGLMTANVGDVLTGSKKLTGRGVRVDMNEGQLTVMLFIVVRYGYNIAEVAEKTQQAALTAVENMTGLSVSAVNVHVGGISFNK